jgi:hypothetical protein
MSKQYKPKVIKCRCSVCREYKADFIVPYLLEEAYCWDCWKKEMESNSDLKFTIASTRFLTDKIKKDKTFRSRWLKQQTENALKHIQKKTR